MVNWDASSRQGLIAIHVYKNYTKHCYAIRIYVHILDRYSQHYFVNAIVPIFDWHRFRKDLMIDRLLDECSFSVLIFTGHDFLNLN